MSEKYKILETYNFENDKQNFKTCVKQNNIPQVPNEQYGFSSELNKYRNDIDSIKNEDWKRVRWFINDYDFLVKDPIINRAFYKYWEIINEFDIFENYNETDLILHCAEAPGGFIQGTNIYLQIDRHVLSENENTVSKPQPDNDGFIEVKKKKKQKLKTSKIYTISLNKDLSQYRSYNLPSYNKNVVNKYVHVTYGKDNTGDINNLENINYIKTISKNNFFLITADGGFDEGTDFNNKEQLHYSLILSEIYAAISSQQTNGHFILKVFDVFTETSIHLLYLLSLCWKNVFIYKPKTSRPTNSEKYIICKNFNLSEENRELIINTLQKLALHTKRLNAKYISFTLFKQIPEEFIQNICDINKSLIQTQCDFLKHAIKLCQDTDFLESYDTILQESIEKRKEIFKKWESTYNLNYYI